MTFNSCLNFFFFFVIVIMILYYYCGIWFWTWQRSILHLCMKLLFICFCHCEASLSLGKVLYKLNIIIIIHGLALCDKNIVRIYEQFAGSTKRRPMRFLHCWVDQRVFKQEPPYTQKKKKCSKENICELEKFSKIGETFLQTYLNIS